MVSYRRKRAATRATYETELFAHLPCASAVPVRMESAKSQQMLF
jgi:hypothetical protein